MNPQFAQPAVNQMPVARQCQIEEQSQILDKALDTLLSSPGSLIDRLSPVSTPQAPTGNAKVEAPREMLVPLANTFRDATDKTQTATAIVCDLLSRLELP